MNVVEKDSGTNLEATPCSGQPAATSQAGDKLHHPRENTDSLLPEDKFLAAEAESAKAAIAETLRALNADLRVAADVRYWTRLHPWIAVGVATAAGFAVGTIAGSTGAETRRAVDGDPAAAERGESAPPEATHEPVVSMLLRWLEHLVSDLFRTFATALAASTVQFVTRAAVPCSPVAPPASQEMPKETDASDTRSASAINGLGDGSGPGKTIHEP